MQCAMKVLEHYYDSRLIEVSHALSRVVVMRERCYTNYVRMILSEAGFEDSDTML